MDIFLILSYLNKISLLAFIITGGFLIYQFYLLKKEISSNSKKTPTIPDFNENEKVEVLNYTKLPFNLNQEHLVIKKKDNKTILSLVIGLSLIILTLGVFLILRLRQSSEVSQVIIPTPTLSVKVLTKIINSPTPRLVSEMTPTLLPTSSPTSTPTLTPTLKPLLSTTPTPTEIIVALVSPTITSSNENMTEETISPTKVDNLPITGVIDQSLILFGAAVSLIFFAFIF